jgi:HrpA-like RNA helicase
MFIPSSKQLENLFSSREKRKEETKIENSEIPNLETKAQENVEMIRQDFPVTKYKNKIIDGIQKNLVTIISAPTGTGKVIYLLLHYYYS